MTVLPFHNETRLLTSPEKIEPIKIFGNYYIARKSFQGRPRCFFVTANLKFKKTSNRKENCLGLELPKLIPLFPQNYIRKLYDAQIEICL